MAAIAHLNGRPRSKPILMGSWYVVRAQVVHVLSQDERNQDAFAKTGIITQLERRLQSSGAASHASCAYNMLHMGRTAIDWTFAHGV